MTSFGGVVVTDAEWNSYAAATTDGRRIRVRFAGDRIDTQIWADGSGGLLCRRGPPGSEEAPLYSYSDAMSDPNTEAASASAVFLQRLVASGLPVELALRLTQQIYRNRPHDSPVPDAIVGRLIEQWRNGGFS